MMILEQHVSRHVLPNEEIFLWIKWDPSINFDRILVEMNTEVEIMKVLNATITKTYKKKFTIDRDMLQIPGFMGFISRYKIVPKFEKQISFKIMFIKNENRLKTVLLKTAVIAQNSPRESEYVNGFRTVNEFKY